MQNVYGGTDKPFQITEIGPGAGTMMSDILRTVHQFQGLKNLDIVLVEASDNLIKKQQEKLLDLIQKQMGIFLTYDLQKLKGPSHADNKAKKQDDYQVERFFNKEANFSISWYQDVRSLYNHSIEKQVDAIQKYKNDLAKI